LLFSLGFFPFSMWHAACSTMGRAYRPLPEVITMLRTRTWLALIMVTTAGALFVPASAQAQSQAINFSVGAFFPTGFDGRPDEDVLVRELSSGFYSLDFDVADFRGAIVGAEWLIGLGRYVDAGVGASFYRRTVPSIYLEVTHPSGAEIEQDLRLRIAPLTASLRFYPMGKFNGLQPYVGAGITRLYFRFSETGDFVDTSAAAEGEIFQARYFHSGSTTAPVFLGGLRATLGDKGLVGGEVRYQTGEGDLPVTGDNAFIAPKIDLGGWTTNFTFGFRF
jgi:hypothetical protein